MWVFPGVQRGVLENNSNVIFLEGILPQAATVNCSVVLGTNPVLTSQTRALSGEGCLLQRLPKSSTLPLKQKAAQITMAPLRCVKAIRTARLYFILSENKTLFHLWLSMVGGVLLNEIWPLKTFLKHNWLQLQFSFICLLNFSLSLPFLLIAFWRST